MNNEPTTDDLVDRLRFQWAVMDTVQRLAAKEEAADEIERLQAKTAVCYQCREDGR